MYARNTQYIYKRWSRNNGISKVIQELQTQCYISVSASFAFRLLRFTSTLFDVLVLCLVFQPCGSNTFARLDLNFSLVCCRQV